MSKMCYIVVATPAVVDCPARLTPIFIFVIVSCLKTNMKDAAGKFAKTAGAFVRIMSPAGYGSLFYVNFCLL